MNFVKHEVNFKNPQSCQECYYLTATPMHSKRITWTNAECGLTGRNFELYNSSQTAGFLRPHDCPFNYAMYCDDCDETYLNENYTFCPKCGKVLTKRNG